MTTTSLNAATAAMIEAINGPLADDFHGTLASAWENRLVNHHRTDLPDDILSIDLEDAFAEIADDKPLAVLLNMTSVAEGESFDDADIDWKAVAAQVKGHPDDFL